MGVGPHLIPLIWIGGVPWVVKKTRIPYCRSGPGLLMFGAYVFLRIGLRRGIMTHRIPRRSRLVSAIRASLRPATATALTVSLTLAAAGPVQAAMENGSPGKAALRPENQAARDEILFMDAHVVAPEKLLVGTKQGVETVILEEGRDGLEQITEVLENRHPVAVHIVAHGESGKLQLGDTWLDAKQLDENVALIRRWFTDSNTSKQPDLLLYACKLAEGTEGVAFVEKLAEIAGADVAASDDITGIDGDWDLEVITGDIEADLAFSEITIDTYPDNLVTFTVNDTADTEDGECDEECTLRDALYVANENDNDPTVDTIQFSLGGSKGISSKGSATYTITQDCEEYGAFTIAEPVVIEGGGPTVNAISGGESYCRLFYVGDSAEDVTFSDLTLYGTHTEGDEYGNGSCIFSTGSDLTLNEVYVYHCNLGDGYGGAGIAFEGSGHTLTVRDSYFAENYSYYGSGGAIYFYDSGGGTLTITESDFQENYSYLGGAGVFFRDESGGTLLVEDSVFTENYAEDSENEEAGGGAILAYVNETAVTVRGSNFSGNGSEEAAGGAMAIIDDGDSTVLIESSGFYENAAFEESAGGGAVFVYMEGTEVTVRDSTFLYNGGGEYSGGAMLFWDQEKAEASEVFIGNSYFAENYTYGSGGAVMFYTFGYDSALTIEDSEFIDNYADEQGGALAVWGESGDVVIRDSFFAENFSDQDGGGAQFFYLDTVSIYASTFYDNDTEGEGGGIELDYVEYANIVNSTFSYNNAEYGGGGIQAHEDSDVYLRHTTVAFNEAESGGGISFFGEEMVIENSIVSDNSADSGPDLYGDTVDVAFSLISNLEEASIENDGGNILNTSADLGPLTFIAGVYTPVHIPDELSPVVDGGDPGFSSPPDFDQRDEPRILGARTDMGSVEQEGILRIIPTLSNWGLAIMALLMAGVSFLGFRRRKDES